MRAVLTVLVLFVFLVPVANAQPGLGEPVTGCRPVECDPQQANEGRVAEDGPVRVILYGHFKNLLDMARLDTETAKGEADLNAGFLTPTVATSTGTPADVHFRNNYFQMVATALPGPFNRQASSGSPADRILLLYDVELAGDTVWGFWYLSPNAFHAPTPVGDPPPAGVMPSVGVYMRMETGHFSGHGTLVAEGATGLGYGAPDPESAAGTVTLLALPGGDSVYEFKVPMRIQERTLPAGDGFVVTVVVYQAATDEAEAMQAGWRVRTGEHFPPRVLFDMQNPAKTLSTHVEKQGNNLLFRWRLTGAWGAFDIDLSSVTLRVDGPRTLTEPDLELVRFQFETTRGRAITPLDALWSYPYGRSGLPDGLYTVTGTALTQQGTYRLVWQETFDVTGGRPQVATDGRTPGVSAVGLLAALGVGVALAGAVRSRP